MITGRVVGYRQAVLPLRIRGSLGEQEIAATIDTGFTSSLALPTEVITALGLTFLQNATVRLADDRLLDVRLFEAIVIWEGELRSVVALEKPGKPLAGMFLLRDCLVQMEVRDGGVVQLSPLGPNP